MPESVPKPSKIFQQYWKFAQNRHHIYLLRLAGKDGPYTDDKILQKFKFTNAYRASDRVSQYLIHKVIYGACSEMSPEDQIFNILLFKIFNRPSTWDAIRDRLGTPSSSTDKREIERVLASLVSQQRQLYSAAYIMPPPKGGNSEAKYMRHIRILYDQLKAGLIDKICRATSLQEIYGLLLDVPSFGKFLAFQYSVDIAYMDSCSADESEFVVAGPGAIRGIAKCFESTDGRTPEEVIFYVYENQERYFAEAGLEFQGLGGRRLQPVDCQNLFCEVDKYTRVSHPELNSASGRNRIKQTFRPSSERITGWFPPKWGINGLVMPQAVAVEAPDLEASPGQLGLF